MNVLNQKYQSPIFVVYCLLFIGCGFCNKELSIEPIAKGSYPRSGWHYEFCVYCKEEGYDYCGESCKDVTIQPCVDSVRFYTIANYERIAPDSLYKILNTYINSKLIYEKYVENIKLNHRECSFMADFYKKSLFVNYGNYIPDALDSDPVGIYQHRDKSVAL